MRRRELLAAVPAVAAAGLGAVRPAEAAGDAKSLPQVGDYLVVDAGSSKGQTVRPDMVPGGGTLLAVVSADAATGQLRNGSRFGKIILLKLAPDDLDETTRQHSADGIVAYSAICTHQGCTLSGWKAEERVIACFCHHSEFEPFASGKVAKGPATRRLPMLPIAVGPNGDLVVVAEFTSKPGYKA